jgi:predicted nuclease with TOPRIM domain
MAGKTLTALTDELLRELITLKTQFSGQQKELDQLDLVTLRERVAKQETILEELKRLAEEAERRGERLAVLESQFAELKKQFEEKDRRWWQFWVGVSAVGLAFVANLVIQLLLLFARKPA